MAFLFSHFGTGIGEPEQARIREVAASVADAMVAAYRLERRDRPITARRIAEWEAQHSEDPTDIIALELRAAFAHGRFGDDIGDPEAEGIDEIAGSLAIDVWYALRLELRDPNAGTGLV